MRTESTLLSPVSGRLRAGALVARDLYRRLRRRYPSARARLAALEAELQEQRQLNRRVAELTDVVVELLIPVQDRDSERAAAVLDRYRDQI